MDFNMQSYYTKVKADAGLVDLFSEAGSPAIRYKKRFLAMGTRWTPLVLCEV